MIMPKFQNDPIVSISNSSDAAAMQGENNAFEGVRGSTSSAHAGVTGINNGQNNGMGVWAASETGEGLHAVTSSDSFAAVTALNNGKGPGIRADSKNWIGVYGSSQSTTGGSGVVGDAVGTGVMGVSSSGIGVHGKGPRLAGFFEGDVEVTGDIRLTNADCAEDFDICDTEPIEPGTVMAVGEDGALLPSTTALSKSRRACAGRAAAGRANAKHANQHHL
jgi:hypothetical protein